MVYFEFMISNFGHREQQANKGFLQLTPLEQHDELEALRAEEADGESQAFHFDYPSLLGARINGRMSWMPWT